MPSSTSSSERFTDDRREGLFTALKITLAGILVFGGVVGIYSGITGAIEGAANDGLHSRALTMIEYLPEITAMEDDSRTMMIFGSSMVQYGFLPPLFDQELANRGIASTSFNYGIANLNPKYQELITRRIREQFEQDGKKLGLTLVELTPFQLTAVRAGTNSRTDEQNVAVLSNNRELWRETLRDPDSGIRMFNIRYLRNGYSAELFASLPGIIAQALTGTRTEEYLAAKRVEEGAQAVFNAAFATEGYPPSPLPGWNPDVNGGPLNTLQLSEETLRALADYSATLRHPVFMEADLTRRIATSDILQLEFEESLVADFIALVQNLQAVSEHLEVVLLPRNTRWVNYTPEVQARLDRLKQRITAETGATVRDFQLAPGITPDHFRDTTHLNATGIEIFTRLLAQQYRDVLDD